MHVLVSAGDSESDQRSDGWPEGGSGGGGEGGSPDIPPHTPGLALLSFVASAGGQIENVCSNCL